MRSRFIIKTATGKWFSVSWNLCLNLCPGKWLKPTRRLVISLFPLWFSQLKTFGIGLISFRILFLKALKLPTFRTISSRLFYSIIAEENKNFRKLRFALKRGMFSIFLVVWGDFFKGNNLKRYWGYPCLLNLKK